MSYCILVPHYQHAAQLKPFLLELTAVGYPLIIVDDGSDATNLTLLQNTVAEYANVHLLCHQYNRGKGAAVKTGLSHARNLGFSHAIQIDADGQHNTADIPRFIDCSKQHPAALICGKPVFDSSAPKIRLYGRRITDFWVALETLSFVIKDGLCGFRIYPLRTAETILDHYYIGSRMDFDTDILVKACWAKQELIFLDTKVIYPEQSFSNFHYWRDNWLLIKLHTRLLFGMLLRLPWLLPRAIKRLLTKHQSDQTGTHWAQLREAGTSGGLKVLFLVHKLGGQPLINLLLYPISLYFFLFRKTARRASRQFLAYHYQCYPKYWRSKPGYLATFQHLLSFSRSTVDKALAWGSRVTVQQFNVINQAIAEELLHSNTGHLIIGSHFGNLEYARHFLQSESERTVNILLYDEKHSANFVELMQQVNPNSRINLYQVDQLDIAQILAFKTKVAAGEWVFIAGDRLAVNPNERSISVNFLGHTARLPIGPYILANTLQCPVELMFAYREHDKIRFEVVPFAQQITLPRQQRDLALQQYAQQFADELAKQCAIAPFQWFNFYDFWESMKP